MDFLSQIKQDSHLTKLLDSIYDGVYIVDLKRRIIFWNQAAEAMTGFSKAEVMGKCCGDNILNHIDENGMLLCRAACPILQVFKDDVSVEAKVYPKSKSGKRFPVQTHISAIHDEDGKIVAAIEVFRDITLAENYRILQEKFNNLIKKYVSTTTYTDIRDRLETDVHQNQPRILDLSVFYLDIVNFTGFSESNPPDEVVKLLNELFGICEVITRECYGDIDKFIGDAIMAVFNDANDAVRAALQIVNTSLPEMNQIRLDNNEQPIAVRIGINSGLVLQGDIGTQDRKDLTVIGDVVNIAARLEKSSAANHVMISEATYSRLDPGNAECFTKKSSMELKGKSERIQTFLSNSDLL